MACADSLFCGNIVGTVGNGLFTADSKALGTGCTVEGNVNTQ